jgi:hypothetical protein
VQRVEVTGDQDGRDGAGHRISTAVGGGCRQEDRVRVRK